MKKIFSLMLVAVLALSLSACKNRKNTTGQNAGNNTGVNQGQMSGYDQARNYGVTPDGVPGTDNTGMARGQDNYGYNQANPNAGNAAGQDNGKVYTGNNAYRDGTYVGEGDMRGDIRENALVIIANGKIQDIQLRSVNNEGKDISAENIGTTPGGGATSNLGQTKRDLINNMLQNQTNEVTTSTTGNTDVVRNWKLAVGRALDKARSANNTNQQ